MSKFEFIIRFIIWLLPLVLVGGLIYLIGLNLYKKFKIKKQKTN